MVNKLFIDDFNQLNAVIKTLESHSDEFRIEVFNEEITGSFNRIKTNLENNFLNDDFSVNGLIHWMQIQLFNSSALLLDILNFETNSLNHHPQLHTFSIEIKSFIDFLRLHFKESFQSDRIAPFTYQVYFFSEWRKQCADFNDFLKLHTVDPQLLHILNDYFKMIFLNNDLFSYKKVDQINNSLNDLIKLQQTNEPLEVSIIETLVKWDINISKFIDYCIKSILNKNETLNLSYKINWQFAALRTAASNPFDSTQNPLRTIIKKALSEERKQNSRLVSSSRKDEKSNTPPSYYFQVKLTLSQLLFFFQVFQESDMLTSKNRTGVYRFITNHIGTLKHQNFSIGSMQRKFGRANRVDVKKVRELLLAMLNNINHRHINSNN